MTARTAPTLWRIFAVPLWPGLASAIGLVAALLEDGVYDVLSWIGLGIPAAAVIWAVAARRR